MIKQCLKYLQGYFQAHEFRCVFSALDMLYRGGLGMKLESDDKALALILNDLHHALPVGIRTAGNGQIRICNAENGLMVP